MYFFVIFHFVLVFIINEYSILAEVNYTVIPYKFDGPRSRTVLTNYQLQILKQEFFQNKFPTPDRKWALSKITGLDYKVITNWFQNKRKIQYRLDKLKLLHPDFLIKEENTRQ